MNGQIIFSDDEIFLKKLVNEDFLTSLISSDDKTLQSKFIERADDKRREFFSNRIYIRGLIEFSNYCKNDCFYCGIRKSSKIARYRLTKDEIMETCSEAYSAGIRTFVLQSGEDLFFSKEKIVDLVSSLKNEFPGSALTLSIGEKPKDEYKAYKIAGADRFLLRHETINKEHYEKLHPISMSFENRLRSLKDLKDLGFQVGSGFMVGSPWQTARNLAEDLRFLRLIQPHMVGIGPFIPQKLSPFKDFPPGSADLTVFLIALIRLLIPDALIPSTTALETMNRREEGIKAGANVIMINISPDKARGKYIIYDGKPRSVLSVSDELEKIDGKLAKAGFSMSLDIGDSPRVL